MPADRPPPVVPEKLIDDFRAALAFLTRLPPRVLGGGADSPPDFRRTAGLFPAVGAVIGIGGGIVLVVASLLGLPALIAASLAVVATILVTGGLHEDGLADVADGLGGATVERRLEIMTDSRIGTYGVIALVFSILIRVAALAGLTAGGAYRAALALVAAEALSRAAMVRMWQDVPAAKPSGLSEDAGAPDQRAMLVALITAAIVVLVTIVPFIGIWAAVAGSVVAALAAYIFIRFAARAIGGRTGDTLGACQQIAAAAFLVAVAAY